MGGARKPATRLEILGWCLFDFANSSYTTLIITVAYAPYFVETVARGAGCSVNEANFLWGLATWLANALVVLTAPIVGAIADFSGAKKRLLFATYVGCVLGTAALWFVEPGDVLLGLTLFVVSCYFFSSGENLIAAFLPEIAPTEAMGRVSGFGWALGYIGGLGSLVACYSFIAGGVGPEQAAGARASFLIVAGFFLVGGLPTFLFLKERAVPRPLPAGEGYVGVGFRRVRQTLRDVRRFRQLFRFLLVFLIYTCGINVVVAYAVIFARQEIGMGMGDVIWLFIGLQVSASIGAFLFGYLQDRMSAKAAIVISLVLWLVVCLGAYITRSIAAFRAVAYIAGFAMGAAQSAGRALVGTFSPPARTAEFFGFWGLFWKVGAVGPLLFGLLLLWTDMRTAFLLTGVFFLLGIAGMLFVDEADGRRAARASEEATAAPGRTP